MARCYNGGKEHKFEARYDEQPGGFPITKASGMTPSELRKLVFLQIYVRDICVWCGEIRERDKP